jgi:catechol 2,3-dioxygenase-like lactoylglutathione lyase family enzyme
MSLRIDTVTIDCRDAKVVAEFWAAALGRSLREDASSEFASLPGDEKGPGLAFIAVPEDRAGKNRVHVDLGAEDRATEVERLVSIGATELASHEEAGFRWTVLADVEGNEFCVL